MFSYELKQKEILERCNQLINETVKDYVLYSVSFEFFHGAITHGVVPPEDLERTIDFVQHCLHLTQYLSDEISKFLSRREDLTDTISQGKTLLYEIEIWFNYHDNLAEVLFEGERIVSYWHKQKWLCGIGSDLSNRAGNIYGEMRQSMEELMHLLTEYVYELEHFLYVLPI